MKVFRQLIFSFLSQLFLLMVLFTLMRMGFYWANRQSFITEQNGIPWSVFIKGGRFDFSAAIILMSAFSFTLVFYQGHTKIKWLYKCLLWVPVIIGLMFEIADWIYFPFNHKRSTAEVLGLVTNQSDFWKLLPSFLRDYYYLFFIALVVLSLYVYVSNRWLKKSKKHQTLNSDTFWKKSLNVLAYWVVLAGISIVGIRGGLQLVPINIRNAVEVVEAQYAPLVLNTPFSIIHTLANQHIPELDWISKEEMELNVSVIHNPELEGVFESENVMIIILESCSKDFTSLSNHEVSYTPFYDELMKESIVFTSAYANGLHSAEGIPAILGSMPSWMSENFTASAYGSNKIQGIASLLGIEGYKSAFFHGAHNGSMGFDVFSKNAGFQYYYGKKEFNNDQYYDGAWGIFDKPFFQYTLNKIDEIGTPFIHALFSISAHSPYTLPTEDQYLETKDYPIYGTIQYTDEALRDFFEQAKSKSWYTNTWFVITADHTSPMNKHPESLRGFQKYEIPLIFYHPTKTKDAQSIDQVVSQIDILPLILNKINYPSSYFAFGHHDLKLGIGMMAELNNQFYVISREGSKFISNDLNNELDQINIEGETQPTNEFWKIYLSYRQKYNEVLIKNSIPLIKTSQL